MPAERDTDPYRPLHRPPMAVLSVFDDGLKTSEPVRVRRTPFIIGREEGDLVLPHDRLISARHAAIECNTSGGRPEWSLRDLNSANGTFVQARHSVLEPDREFAVARQRLRFVAPEVQEPDQEGPAPESDVRSTMPWSSLMKRRKSEPTPMLVESLPGRDGRRFALTKTEQWIGRAHGCEILFDDPTVSPRHARIFKAPDGTWHVEDANSLNGLWIRVETLPLSSGAFFLLGEQVFLIMFP